MKSALRQVKDFIINHIRSQGIVWFCGSVGQLRGGVVQALRGSACSPWAALNNVVLWLFYAKKLKKHFQECNWREGVMSLN